LLKKISILILIAYSFYAINNSAKEKQILFFKNNIGKKSEFILTIIFFYNENIFLLSYNYI
jgi:hypothetical protein